MIVMILQCLFVEAGVTEYNKIYANKHTGGVHKVFLYGLKDISIPLNITNMPTIKVISTTRCYACKVFP